MGHFGRKAIMVSWLYIAFPCLMLNYLSQSALLLANPPRVENPFFTLARLMRFTSSSLAAIPWRLMPASDLRCLLGDAAGRLGFLPPAHLHTSQGRQGQI